MILVVNLFIGGYWTTTEWGTDNILFLIYFLKYFLKAKEYKTINGWWNSMFLQPSWSIRCSHSTLQRMTSGAKSGTWRRLVQAKKKTVERGFITHIASIFFTAFTALFQKLVFQCFVNRSWSEEMLLYASCMEEAVFVAEMSPSSSFTLIYTL